MTARRLPADLMGALDHLIAVFRREHAEAPNALLYPASLNLGMREACADLIRYTDPNLLHAGLPPSIAGLRPIASHAAQALTVDRLDLPDPHGPRTPARRWPRSLTQ